eukprot:PhF_6_TR13618/c0_g1_i1/m.21794
MSRPALTVNTNTNNNPGRTISFQERNTSSRRSSSTTSSRSSSSTDKRRRTSAVLAEKFKRMSVSSSSLSSEDRSNSDSDLNARRNNSNQYLKRTQTFRPPPAPRRENVLYRYGSVIMFVSISILCLVVLTVVLASSVGTGLLFTDTQNAQRLGNDLNIILEYIKWSSLKRRPIVMDALLHATPIPPSAFTQTTPLQNQIMSMLLDEPSQSSYAVSSTWLRVTEMKSLQSGSVSTAQEAQILLSSIHRGILAYAAYKIRQMKVLTNAHTFFQTYTELLYFVEGYAEYTYYVLIQNANSSNSRSSIGGGGGGGGNDIHYMFPSEADSHEINAMTSMDDETYKSYNTFLTDPTIREFRSTLHGVSLATTAPPNSLIRIPPNPLFANDALATQLQVFMTSFYATINTWYTDVMDDLEEKTDQSRTLFILCVFGALCGGLFCVIVTVGLIVLARRHAQEKKLKELSDELAETTANAIANMDLEAVEFLEDIRRPTPILLSFLNIVRVLKQYRAFLPASTYAKSEHHHNNGNGNSSHDDDGNGSVSSLSLSRRRLARTADPSNIASLCPCVFQRICTLVHVHFLHHSGIVKSLYDQRGSAAVLEDIGDRVSFIERIVEVQHGVVMKLVEDSITIGYNVVARVGTHTINGCRSALALHKRFNLRSDGIMRISVSVHTSNALCGFVGSDTTRTVATFTKDLSLVPMMSNLSLEKKQVISTPGVLAVRNSFRIEALPEYPVSGDWIFCKGEESMLYMVLEEVHSSSSAVEEELSSPIWRDHERSFNKIMPFVEGSGGEESTPLTPRSPVHPEATTD